jgi:hypothetical protein
VAPQGAPRHSAVARCARPSGSSPPFRTSLRSRLQVCA